MQQAQTDTKKLTVNLNRRDLKVDKHRHTEQQSQVNTDKHAHTHATSTIMHKGTHSKFKQGGPKGIQTHNTHTHTFVPILLSI